MFTKLLMMSGRLVVSATNPVATINAKVAAGLNSSRTRMATTIGRQQQGGAVVGEDGRDGCAQEYNHRE